MRYVFYALINLLLLSSTFAQSNKFQAGEILLKNGIQKTGYLLGQFNLDVPKGIYFKLDEVDIVLVNLDVLPSFVDII